MKKHLWQYLRMIEGRLEAIPIGEAATITLKCVDVMPPGLWIDFLNADPEAPRSLWPVYKKFSRAMQDLIEGMDKARIQYDDDVRDMRLLSRDDFVAEYDSVRECAKAVHGAMKEFVLGGKPDLLKNLAKISCPGVTVTITDLMQTNSEVEIHVTLFGASLDKFWLCCIGRSIFGSYMAGKVGRLCAAPDCDWFFIPSPRRPDQKYHLTRCQNRTFMRKARSEERYKS